MNAERKRQGLLFLASTVLGFALWVASPLLFRVEEPWDAPGLTYQLALCLIGALGGFFFPRAFWLIPAGLFLGQFAFGFLSWARSMTSYSGGGVNFFIPVGAMFLFGASVPSLICAALGAFVARARR